MYIVHVHRVSKNCKIVFVITSVENKSTSHYFSLFAKAQPGLGTQVWSL